MTLGLAEAVLIIVLSGIFGWMLGKLPDRWVHLIIAAAIVLTLVVLKTTAR